MNAGKIKAVLFIIVFLLIVALVCAWVTGGDAPTKVNTSSDDPIVVPIATADPNKPQPTSAPATPTPQTPAPQQNNGTQQNNGNGEVQVANPTPTPTAAPAATPAPANTPDPAATAAPQVTTAPTSGNSIASGSFTSKTGTGLDMRAEWSAVATGNNTATVTVNVYAVSYSLYLAENEYGLKLSLGNQYTTAPTTGLEYSGNSQKTTLLGTKSFSIDVSKGKVTLPLAIEWHYMGSYGGVAIDVIECGGNVVIG